METATTKDRRSHQNRLMIRRDLPGVLAIENATAAGRGVEPWDEGDFLLSLRQRNCIGFVAFRGEEMTGFMVYELHRAHLHVLRFAAAPGTDAGAELYAKLLYKVGTHRRQYLTAQGADGRLVYLGNAPEVRPEWLTLTVRALCEGGAPYTPVLADALEEAGCDDAEFLSALRDEGVGPTVFAAVADQFAG